MVQLGYMLFSNDFWFIGRGAGCDPDFDPDFDFGN